MCYTICVHKTLYASGFLYRPQSQQILLQQLSDSSDTSYKWTMVGGAGNLREEADAAFQRIVNKTLKLKIPLRSIYAVYDYFHPEYKTSHFVFYAEVSETARIGLNKKPTFSWLTFKQILKLSFTEQTKQDVIVAQRVIQARSRAIENNVNVT